MSPEHEARSRVFYDHEDDEPRTGGRRRRPVADWGVEEDVFDRMPSRRFARRGEEPRSRTIVIERGPEPRAQEWEPADEPAPRFERAPEPRAHAPAARAAGLVEARDARAARADGRDERETRATRRDGRYAQRAVTDVLGAAAEERPAGRRTIVIGGHPDRLPVRRSRPPRTAVERIGPRPDRIVAYSVALGLLLILIAILTSH